MPAGQPGELVDPSRGRRQLDGYAGGGRHSDSPLGRRALRRALTQRGREARPLGRRDWERSPLLDFLHGRPLSTLPNSHSSPCGCGGGVRTHTAVVVPHFSAFDAGGPFTRSGEAKRHQIRHAGCAGCCRPRQPPTAAPLCRRLLRAGGEEGGVKAIKQMLPRGASRREPPAFPPPAALGGSGYPPRSYPYGTPLPRRPGRP